MRATSVIAPPAYEAPALVWADETAQAETYVWWVVFVGFAYTLALAYASYCRWSGGSADISFGWGGFRVACHK